MRYYKVTFKIGVNNARIYPPGIDGIVWTVTQDHSSENVMVGATNGQAKADGDTVIQLTEDDALRLIEEFKNTYPRVEPHDLTFPPKTRK